MRKRNVLAGLLLLPLGATAGLFWWMQKAKPKFDPESLIKANIAFWKSPAGQKMSHYPVFGVRISTNLPPTDYYSEPDTTVTVVPQELVNDAQTQKLYGKLVGYDETKALPFSDLSFKLLQLVPKVRIINIRDDHPWLKTDSFKEFVLLSGIKYKFAYGLLPKGYRSIRLQTRVTHICRGLEAYLQGNMLEAPEQSQCIKNNDIRYIRQNVIPFMQKIRNYLATHDIRPWLEDQL